MTEERILCKCHKKLIRTEFIRGKPFTRKVCKCAVTGDQLFEFDTERVKLKVPLKDDTWPGDDVESADIDDAVEDYKKRQGGDD